MDKRIWQCVRVGALTVFGPCLLAADPAPAAAAAPAPAPAAKEVAAPAEAAPADPKQVVATFEGGQLTLGDVQAEVDRQGAPYMAHRLSTPEGRRVFVENLVRDRVFAAEARKRGMDKDPAFLARVETLLAQELLRRLRTDATAAPVTDDEVKAFYQAHEKEFNRPERRMVSQILLAVPANASVEDKAKKGELAKTILDELGKVTGPQQAQTFAKLASQYTEDPIGKARMGHCGEIQTDTAPSEQYPEPMIKAVAGLKNTGDLSGAVSSDKGLHIIRLDRLIPASNQTFDQAKESIQQRIRSTRLTQPNAGGEGIMKKANLDVKADALGQLKVPRMPVLPGAEPGAVPGGVAPVPRQGVQRPPVVPVRPMAPTVRPATPAPAPAPAPQAAPAAPPAAAPAAVAPAPAPAPAAERK